jgi:DNA repair exonuclease SbcCD ATPase subunit
MPKLTKQTVIFVPAKATIAALSESIAELEAEIRTRAYKALNMFNANEQLIDERNEQGRKIAELEAENQSLIVRLNASPAWVCFHCKFSTSVESEALGHFGDGDPGYPLCIAWKDLDADGRASAYAEISAQAAELFQDNCEKAKRVEEIEAEIARLTVELERQKVSLTDIAEARLKQMLTQHRMDSDAIKEWEAHCKRLTALLIEQGHGVGCGSRMSPRSDCIKCGMPFLYHHQRRESERYCQASLATSRPERYLGLAQPCNCHLSTLPASKEQA